MVQVHCALPMTLQSCLRLRGRQKGPAVVARAVGQDALASVVEHETGLGVTNSQVIGQSGWSAQHVYTLKDGTKLFAKSSRKTADEMFKGEALGLRAMYDTHTLRVPKVIAYGDFTAGSYLITEHMNFGGRVDQRAMGRQLAKMHAATPKGAKGFGFDVDNTIGGTPQPNPWTDDWVSFFRDNRLLHQVRLAGDSELQRLAQPIAERLHELFDGVDVRPSVLHGDLWSGNMASVDGEPAVFDPAVYYGHHEADFGMSWCAGWGFAFYEAYHEVLPKAPGFERRRDLYLLYHYLNHYNLFGSGYYGECQRLMHKLHKAMNL